MENPSSPDSADIAKGKTNAILAYCTPVGWLVGFLLHGNDKSHFAAYHLRQGLGLWLIAIGIGIAASVFLFIFWMFFIAWIIRFLDFGIVAFAIMGIMNANNGKREGIPFFADTFDKMFSGLN